MTLQERGRLGNQAVARRARDRQRVFQAHLAEGLTKQRAAHAAGVSIRTASRYLPEAAR